MHDDPDAVIREHAPFVWRVLRHLGVPERQLEDLSQEVLLVVFQKLPGYEARSSLRTWIYGICRNVASAARRAPSGRELLRESLPELPDPTGPDHALWLKRAQEQLVQALDRLDDEQRAIFVLYEIEELSMEEIASAFGSPITTCYSRLYAARRKVEALLRRQQNVAPSRRSHGGAP
jgi:RNA polymerase sigma-70 factor (ECF subfamily)